MTYILVFLRTVSNVCPWLLPKLIGHLLPTKRPHVVIIWQGILSLNHLHSRTIQSTNLLTLTCHCVRQLSSITMNNLFMKWGRYKFSNCLYCWMQISLKTYYTYSVLCSATSSLQQRQVYQRKKSCQNLDKSHVANVHIGHECVLISHDTSTCVMTGQDKYSCTHVHSALIGPNSSSI